MTSLGKGALAQVLARVIATLALISLAAAAQAQAQDANPCATTGASVQRLLQAVPACQKDALFLATLGQKLNEAARYLEAADHLERALMLDASLKDAQLSYAIALTGSGDLASADALLAQLLADPALPSALRPLIEKQQAALGELARASGAAALAGIKPGGWQSRLTLAARVGYDSNLLGSPNLGSMALTLAGQTLVLALDDSYLARSGNYVRAEAQVDAQRSAADGSRWDAMASLRSRYSATVAEAGSSQLDLLLERSQGQDGGLGHYLNATGTVLESKAGMHYTATGLAGGLVWRASAAPACQARLGLEWQARNYLQNPVLSGRYGGTAAYLTCQTAAGPQWLLGLKTGHDQPQDELRAGGEQQQSSLRLSAYLPRLAPLPGGLLLDLEQSRQNDATGYSPIIENGLARSVARRSARLEYQLALSQATLWLLGAEKIAQSSTLELFQQDSWGAYSGLRVSW